MPPASERERKVFLIYGLSAIAYLTVVHPTLVASFVMTRAGRVFGLAGVIITIGTILLLLRGQIAGWAAASGARFGNTARRCWPGRCGSGWRSVSCWSSAARAHSLVHHGDRPVHGGAHPRHPGRAAPDTGYVATVLVREGTAVPAGAPLVRLRDFGLEHLALRDAG